LYINTILGDKFNLHGLWPTGTAGKPCNFISDCREEDYDPSTFSNNTNILIDEYWVGCFSDAIDFRGHEVNFLILYA